MGIRQYQVELDDTFGSGMSITDASLPLGSDGKQEYGCEAVCLAEDVVALEQENNGLRSRVAELEKALDRAVTGGRLAVDECCRLLGRMQPGTAGKARGRRRKEGVHA